MKKTNTLTIAQLVAIKNNEVFRVECEGVTLEAKISELVAFARRHGLSSTKLEEIVFDNDIISDNDFVEEVPVATKQEIIMEKDHKAAVEAYNTTEGSEKFEKHKRTGNSPKIDYAKRIAYANNRQNERVIASNNLSDLRKKKNVTKVAKRTQTAKVVNVFYVPENTFIPSEAKKTKTSRLMVEVKTSSGRTNLINIADNFHRKVGRCSKKRIAALMETVKRGFAVEISNREIVNDMLHAWYVDAGLNVKCF